MIKQYPRLFSEDDGISIGSVVSLDEVKSILHQFAKDKAPRPDGWKV